MSESKPLPHRYVVASAGTPKGSVSLTSMNLQDLAAAPPSEFGGPGDQWSPETLFASSIASCFELTFRAIARSARLDWNELHCEVEAVLDRIEKVVRFKEVLIRARLTVRHEADREKAKRLLEKVDKACLIANSIVCAVRLEAEVDVA